MAIREAIEKGGFEPTYMDDEAIFDGDVAQVFLDRDFWQALGKAQGWDDHNTCYHLGAGAYRHKIATCDNPFKMGHWLYEQHRFIDHLASGADAESWFAALNKVDATKEI